MNDRLPELPQRAMQTPPLSRHFFNREGEKHGDVKAPFIWCSEPAEEPINRMQLKEIIALAGLPLV
jgi:hypothetical protein